VAVAVVDVQVRSSGAVNSLRQINSASKQAQGALQGLARAAAGLALVEFGRRSVQAAASLNDLNTRLKLLTSEYGEFERAQRLASEAAKQFGLSNREATEGVADIYARLRPLGISLSEISSTFKGFNVIAKLSGVSAAGASAAFTQLAQALGSGRLQGDEFRSIAEQVPGLLQAVAEETGKSVGELKEFASQGKLTSDILIRALQKVEKEGAGKIAKIVKESDVQRFKDLQNAVDELSTAFGQTLLPAVTPIVKVLTDLVRLFGQLPSPIRTTAVAVGLLAAAVRTFNGAVSLTLLGKLGTALATLAGVTNTLTTGFTVAGAAVTKTNLVITASTVAAGALKVALLALPWVAVAAGVGFFVSKIIEANNKQKELNETIKTGGREALEAALNTSLLAQAQAQQRIENLKASGRASGAALRNAKADLELQNANIRKIRDRLGILAEESELEFQKKKEEEEKLKNAGKRKDISKEQLRLEELLFAAQIKGDQQEQAYLEKLIRREQILSAEMKPRERIKAYLDSELQYSERIKQIRQEISDIMAGARITPSESSFDGSEASGIFTAKDARAQHLDTLKQKLQDLANPLEQIKAISSTIGDAFSQGIKGMVEGTVTARQALAGFFKSVADSFLNMATEIINAAIRMMAFQIISSLFPGAPKFSASSMVLPGLSGSLNVPGILPGISPAGALASGGTAIGGKSYLVGEKGPELFTPGRTGSVTPNSAIGGANIVVNVDAKGTQAQGNQPNSEQLGRLIGSAVQAELIKQKRPGGLLTQWPPFRQSRQLTAHKRVVSRASALLSLETATNSALPSG